VRHPPISAVVKDEKEELESGGKRWPKTGSESKRANLGMAFFY